MKIQSGRDFWSGILFIVTGAVFAWSSTIYPFGTSAQPGPGYFPFGLGLLLALIGVVVTIGSWKIKTEDGEPIGRWSWRPLLLISAAVAVFGIILQPFGMILSLPMLVVATSWASDEFRWKEALGSAAILTFGCWAVFSWALKLQLPLWPSFLGI
ncbi:tripartite tricarboxylate transporter TctB family protein [Nocardioides sp. NPDC004968]|uniref:tripartite tricarboxylate transporter TctB family protein n=1 Tax=Nocardioides sp. NPDC004968 TaxID=3155894 RepID=UPI0033B5ACF2